MSAKHTKYIFVTGGVVSSIGKGLAAASIGALMEARGLLREVTGQGRFRMWRTALPHNKALASSPLPARK